MSARRAVIACLAGLSACATPASEPEPAKTTPPVVEALTPGSPLADYVYAVAREQPPLPVFHRIDGQPYAGRYLGDHDGCSVVAVTDRIRHTRHYRHCQGEVIFDARQPPQLPEDVSLEQARAANALESLRLKRRAVRTAGPLTLRAHPETPPDTRGCQVVEDVVVYDGLLVDIQHRESCL